MSAKGTFSVAQSCHDIPPQFELIAVMGAHFDNCHGNTLQYLWIKARVIGRTERRERPCRASDFAGRKSPHAVPRPVLDMPDQKEKDQKWSQHTFIISELLLIMYRGNPHLDADRPWDIICRQEKLTTGVDCCLEWSRGCLRLSFPPETPKSNEDSLHPRGLRKRLVHGRQRSLSCTPMMPFSWRAA